MQLDFIIPGFSKCGTTSLCSALGQHPDIFIPASKEPNFFAENFSRGLTWYAESFEQRTSQRLVGEGSTMYSTAEYALISCRRILKHSPNCKFIFLARDPVARLESSFREMHASGDNFYIFPSLDLGKALIELPNILEDSRYWRLLSHYRSLVPDSRILVLFLKDLRDNFDREIKRCYDFLGVDTNQSAGSLVQLNAAETKSYDKTLLRFMKTNAITKLVWWRIPKFGRDTFATKFQLRKTFDKPVPWCTEAVELFEQIVAPDARKFLSHFNKPDTFWNLNVREKLRNVAQVA